ncbi:hypothetical protein ACFCYN_04520 [Gottfriedia sp. NPDC056225]|uniref:hypothetical protein n=1 Tax=Gottfriedia sp. NPDC056225 TaxID=3345751 RepID=UPI0035D72264
MFSQLNNNKHYITVRQIMKNKLTFEWSSVERKEQIWRLYFYFIVLIFSVFTIFINLDKWYTFEPLIISLGCIVVLQFLLVYLLNNKEIQFLIFDVCLHLRWLYPFANWISNHFIMISILILFSITGIDAPNIFIIAAVIILVIVHIITQYSQEKGSNNPYISLWLGLIGTFIGFTLSAYAQGAFNEKHNKSNLISTLDIAIENASTNSSTLDSQIRDILYRVKEKEEITPSDVLESSIKNNALEQILIDGELNNSLSQIGKERLSDSYWDSLNILLDSDAQTELRNKYEKVKNKKNDKDYQEYIKSCLDLLEIEKISQIGISEFLEIEKQYQNKSINEKEYEDRLTEFWERFNGYSKNINKTTFKDYLDILPDDDHTLYIDPITITMVESSYEKSLKERLENNHNNIK